MEKKTKKSLQACDKPKKAAMESQKSLTQVANELAAKDSRFAHVLKNPIYRSVPKNEKKIDIDTRFQSMFHDKKFKLKYTTDKRGRPVNTSTDENLQRYYNLNLGEASSDLDTEDKSDVKDEIKSEDEEVKSEDETSTDSEEEEETEGDVKEDVITIKTKTKLPDQIKKKLRDKDIDYARGEGAFVSGESSDEDSSTSEDEDDKLNVMHEWGELDNDATRTEDSTKRLALCNMDWDRLKAVDLMVLFSSFLPAGGLLKNVTIYPSEFGKQRMAEEELQGPSELAEFKVKVEIDDQEGDPESGQEEDEDEEGNSYHREKLRKYQLNRLRYFYAVLEFNSAAAAENVYTECDGREYESSAAKIDLRFVPDDMEFDEVPKDRCENVPESGKYRPKFFTTTALQQVKVDCTWDETDPTRKEMIEKVFNPKEKIDDEDIRAYLASSSGSEEENEDEDNVEDDSKAIGDPISKYRALLESIEESENKKKEKDVEMEITWGVGLKQKTEELVKNKIEKTMEEKQTPWEEQISKLKEKKKLRKVAKKKMGAATKSSDQSSGDEGGQPFSDDDVDIDMNDAFFKDEMRTNDVFKSAKNAEQKEKKNNSGKNKHNKPEHDPKSNAELELLLMDDQEHKKHFSLKKIIDDENESKSKKKRRKHKKAKKPLVDDMTSAKDDFSVDVSDQRFSAMFNSHHFNIDPSDPNFKKTKAMDVIISEKQKRRLHKAKETTLPTSSDHDHTDEPPKKLSKTGSINNAELSLLVKSVKRNAQSIKRK